MKLSVSISEDDVALVDEYARTSGLRSRSAVVQHAIHLLRHRDLEVDYASAWHDWETSGEGTAWDSTVNDGLCDASR
jgi:Arc/MetJ-type ribon-helix-helix transcriptional regulator